MTIPTFIGIKYVNRSSRWRNGVIRYIVRYAVSPNKYISDALIKECSDWLNNLDIFAGDILVVVDKLRNIDFYRENDIQKEVTVQWQG